MSATIYLHIGANKTGSSALQSVFNKHRDKLVEQGLLYPVSGCVGDAHYGVSSLLGFYHGKPKPIDLMSKPLVELSDALRSEIERNNAESVVISSESFVLPKSVDTVRNFFAGYDVKIVVYVRRHDKWWPSAYNQAVRMVVSPPWGRGFNSYLNYHNNLGPCPSRGGYRLLLDRWSGVFGKENMIVRPYEKQQNEPGIFADFCRAIGHEGDVNEYSGNNLRMNDSVDATTLSFIETFQRARISPDVREKLIKYASCIGRGAEGEVAIDPEILLNLVHQNQAEYEYIAREYLGRTNGVLFYDPLPDVSVPWRKIKQPSPADVVELVVSVMSDKSCYSNNDINAN